MDNKLIGKERRSRAGQRIVGVNRESRAGQLIVGVNCESRGQDYSPTLQLLDDQAKLLELSPGKIAAFTRSVREDMRGAKKYDQRSWSYFFAPRMSSLTELAGLARRMREPP